MITLSIDKPTVQEVKSLLAAARALDLKTVFFPKDPLVAPFPSPDNSTALVLDGKLGGAPYLRNRSGSVFRFRRDALGAPVAVSTEFGNGYRWAINERANQDYQPATAMLVRGGEVYVAVPGGGWTLFEADDPTRPNTNQILPPPLSEDTPAPPPPQDPPRSEVAPGSSGRVVIADGTLADAIVAARPGDTVQLDPARTYAESVLIDKPLLIDGGGRIVNPGVIDASFVSGARVTGSGVDELAWGKGGIVPLVDCIVRGLDISGFGLDSPESDSTAAVRNTGPGHFIVEDCYIHDNQMGIAGGGYPASWIIRNSILLDNGIGDGYSHNIYLTTDNIRVTLENVVSVVSRSVGRTNGGHAFKTRAPIVSVTGGYFHSSDATSIDIPDGTAERAVISSATVVKAAGDENHGLAGYAVESTRNGTAGLLFRDCRLVAECDDPFISAGGGSDAVLVNCQTVGNQITVRKV